MMKFNEKVSNRVKCSVGKCDRRRGSLPRNADGAYIKGFRKKERSRRPSITDAEAIAIEVQAYGTNSEQFSTKVEYFRGIS